MIKSKIKVRVECLTMAALLNTGLSRNCGHGESGASAAKIPLPARTRYVVPGLKGEHPVNRPRLQYRVVNAAPLAEFDEK